MIFQSLYLCDAYSTCKARTVGTRAVVFLGTILVIAIATEDLAR
jgi:hypothetical protein